jgi:hypothetical protein
MVRTAGHITEVVDGFQVLRTESAGATFRLYARITQCLQARRGRAAVRPWPGSAWARERLRCAAGARAHGVHGSRVPSRWHPCAALTRGVQPRWQLPRGRSHCHASLLSAVWASWGGRPQRTLGPHRRPSSGP